MKRYKSNYVFTSSFYFCNVSLEISSSVLIPLLILFPTKGAWKLLLLVDLFFIAFFIITGNISHFLISLFTKHTVFIDEEDTLTVKGKKINTQSIQLKNVKHVVFDQGEVIRNHRDIPCSITMYTRSKSLTINNPSFFMMCQLRKRLKNATFKFNNYKSHIILFSIFTTISLIVIIIFKILSAYI